MGFVSDLKLGNKYEKKALEYIDYDEYEIMKGKCKEYDIIVKKNKRKIYYEVKCDRLTHKTGNIAIEYMCNKKPSGITSTRSTYWIYFVLKDGKIKDVYKLPVYIIRRVMGKFRSINGGDGWRSAMRLVPIEKFKKFIILPLLSEKCK